LTFAEDALIDGFIRGFEENLARLNSYESVFIYNTEEGMDGKNLTMKGFLPV